MPPVLPIGLTELQAWWKHCGCCRGAPHIFVARMPESNWHLRPEACACSSAQFCHETPQPVPELEVFHRVIHWWEIFVVSSWFRELTTPTAIFTARTEENKVSHISQSY